MGIYREHFLATSSEPREEWDMWHVYEQPAWRHYVHVALQEFSLHTDRVQHMLDPLVERLHRRHCNDDCVTGTVRRVKPYWRTPEGKAEREEMGPRAFFQLPDAWDESVETYCGRDPFCMDVDDRIYRFHRKDYRLIGTVTGPRRVPSS